MTPILIAGKPHHIVDFKTEFTKRQLKKVTACLSGLVETHKTTATALIGGVKSGDDLVALITAAPALLDDARLNELLCAVILPDGEAYDEAKVPDRLAGMEDVPVGLIVEAIKSFFPSTKKPVENSTITSTTQAA